MESRMIAPVNVADCVASSSDRSGFMLVTVLIITAVGLLFGSGALLLFRFQCQLRIDRQHELEKLYAVRSVLNYVRTYTGEIGNDGRLFGYRTNSNRELKMLVKPVDPIFPNTNNVELKHFCMERGDFKLVDSQYNEDKDYEYGASGTTNLCINCKADNNSKLGLAFDVCDVTNSVIDANAPVKWWVNIGMRGTGGWLEEDYGRRYFFLPLDYVSGDGGTNDVIRLCIIRDVTNTLNEVKGMKYGWPLSKGERALVFEIKSRNGDSTNNAEIAIYEYVDGTDRSLLDKKSNCPSLCNMGIQIAGDKITAFYIGNGSENENGDAKLSSRGYNFLNTRKISKDTYAYFYDGLYTNNVGKVCSADLRVVIEVESITTNRKGPNTDLITDFKVTPAYQYDVYIEHPVGVTNRATVAQKVGEYDRQGSKYTVISYDTHGTENKGFRKDEKLAREGKK